MQGVPQRRCADMDNVPCMPFSSLAIVAWCPRRFPLGRRQPMVEAASPDIDRLVWQLVLLDHDVLHELPDW